MSWNAWFRNIGLVIVVASFSGCASTASQRANLKQIYDRTAQYHKPDRNPIIVIPGILGSRLVDEESGVTVWGAFRADFADPNTADGARLISLPIDGQSNAVPDRVHPDGVLENLELQLGGFPIKIQAYAGILNTLGAGGYRDETLGLNSVDYGTDHFTCFQFDYDWRRDITENAANLKAFIEEKRRDVQRSYEREYGIVDAEVKFDIAAHSMGSLLTRYYLRYGDSELPEDGTVPELTWAGADDLERIILVAPPNAGALEAFEQLLNGFNIGRPLLPQYQSALLGTFPSVYQLLPRARHAPIVWDKNLSDPVEDYLDPALWQEYGWGLSADDEETTQFLSRVLPEIEDPAARRELAIAFQEHALARAEQFHASLDRPAATPPGVELFLVAGDSVDTPEIGSVDSETGAFSILRHGVGDGTALRSSALMDERVGGEWSPTLRTPIDWKSVMFLSSEHRKLTREPTFEDNVLYWLLEDPRSPPTDEPSPQD